MNSPRDYRWLLVGLATGLALPAVGFLEVGLGALERFAPFPWRRVAAGAAVFAFFAAIHFRARLVRVVALRRRERERQQAAARLVAAAVDDGMRWLRVIQENLELVASEHTAGRETALYLDGARAHADKLEQAFERITGNQQALERDSR